MEQWVCRQDQRIAYIPVPCPSCQTKCSQMRWTPCRRRGYSVRIQNTMAESADRFVMLWLLGSTQYCTASPGRISIVCTPCNSSTVPCSTHNISWPLLMFFRTGMDEEPFRDAGSLSRRFQREFLIFAVPAYRGTDVHAVSILQHDMVTNGMRDQSPPRDSPEPSEGSGKQLIRFYPTRTGDGDSCRRYRHPRRQTANQGGLPKQH